jgi:hypothetical protein
MNSHRISGWLALTTLTLAAASFASGATYYVDANAGNDSNSGTSQGAAWQTLAKVDATTFQPGDQILFLCGDVWTGVLSPLGSGANGSPIVINTYGSGALPLIQGNGATGGAVSLNNQSYWEINNLEVTNSASSAGDRTGIQVTASNFGLISHIHIVGCLVHNVTGTVGQTITDKRTGGIYIGVTADNTTPTRFDDVLVDSCTVHDCSNQGIMTDNHDINLSGVTDNTNYPNTAGWTARHFSHVTISNNLVYNVTKNAMIVRLTDNTGLVEYNVVHDTATALSGNSIYTVSSSGTVFQHNEGYNNRTPVVVDGEMYDSDLQSPGSVWQYSYSHNNNFGLILFDTNTADTGMVVRYNISQNDKGGGRGIIYFNYAFKSCSVYNNDIYVGSGINPIILMGNTANHHAYSFSNNIIDDASTGATYSLNGGDAATYTHNVFFGNHPAGEPADGSKLTSDPLFVSPGSGGNGITTVNGYQLKAGSPAIGSGILISNNGGQDYWGNAVSASAAPNRGAYNGAGVGSGSSVAAPAFSPAAGTYSSAQSVSISTTAGGASIHYTTDGSTPTSTTGTLYSGPVSISATTTLKAIAFNSGGSSSVTSGTYTISSSTGKITLQAGSLTPMGSGQALSDNADAAAPGGTYEKIDSTAVGNWIQFTTPSIPAGTYSLSFIYRTSSTHGQNNVSVDGTQVGTTIVDQYAAAASYPPAVTIGSVTFSTTGTHTIRLTVTGKNAAATNYQLTAVQFILQ